MCDKMGLHPAKAVGEVMHIVQIPVKSLGISAADEKGRINIVRQSRDKKLVAEPNGDGVYSNL